MRKCRSWPTPLVDKHVNAIALPNFHEGLVAEDILLDRLGSDPRPSNTRMPLKRRRCGRVSVHHRGGNHEEEIHRRAHPRSDVGNGRCRMLATTPKMPGGIARIRTYEADL